MISILLICLTALVAQQAHYRDKRQKVEAKHAGDLVSELQAHIKRIKDMESKLAAMAMKIGFK